MKILIVDDEADIRETIASLLEFEEIEALTAENGLAARRLLEHDVFAAVVTDLSMPGMNGLELLEWIQQEGPAIPVIMMSAYGDVEDAVAAVKLGAQDYIVKPFKPDELLIRLKRILKNRELQDMMAAGQQKALDIEGWIGKSPSMLAIRNLLEKVAPTPSTILITGESGTGKEVIAQAVHARSPRAKKALMAVNIAGVPESLLESELFGYEKGAFTGAGSRKPGMFELASGSTLFLDEIGDMPMHLQVKLLRVIQERKIQRLGGTQRLPINVRILAATNRKLEERIAEGLFREDLYYRLNVIHIQLPALRERREDIPLLAGHFIKKYNAAIGKRVEGMQTDAIRALQHYNFPGNVRELENIIERAVILAEKKTITLKDLGMLPTAPQPAEMHATMDEIQKQAIINTLTRCDGNRSKAARELGLDRKTIQNKIKEYGLDGL